MVYLGITVMVDCAWRGGGGGGGGLCAYAYMCVCACIHLLLSVAHYVSNNTHLMSKLHLLCMCTVMYPPVAQIIWLTGVFSFSWAMLLFRCPWHQHNGHRGTKASPPAQRAIPSSSSLEDAIQARSHGHDRPHPLYCRRQHPTNGRFSAAEIAHIATHRGSPTESLPEIRAQQIQKELSERPGPDVGKHQKAAPSSPHWQSGEVNVDGAGFLLLGLSERAKHWPDRPWRGRSRGFQLGGGGNSSSGQPGVQNPVIGSLWAVRKPPGVDGAAGEWGWCWRERRPGSGATSPALDDLCERQGHFGPQAGWAGCEGDPQGVLCRAEETCISAGQGKGPGWSQKIQRERYWCWCCSWLHVLSWRSFCNWLHVLYWPSFCNWLHVKYWCSYCNWLHIQYWCSFWNWLHIQYRCSFCDWFHVQYWFSFCNWLHISAGVSFVTGFTFSPGVPFVIGFTFSTGVHFVTGFTFSTGVHFVTGFTFSTGVPFVIGFTFSTGVHFVTGFTFSTGVPFLTGFTFSTGFPFVIGFTFSAGVSFVTGFTFSAGVPFVIGFTFSTGVPVGVGITFRLLWAIKKIRGHDRAAQMLLFFKAVFW